MQAHSPLSIMLLWPCLLCVSLVNILPLLLFNAGGDTLFHHALFECFASQFWQGDLYPRWCMNGNSGLGVPAFYFYFPLPYYAAALLYPLTWAGVSLQGVYIASLYGATFLTGLGLVAWLRRVTTPGRALLVSMLVLFLPYRMEAMLFRAGYAEIWGMVFCAPLFLALRQLVQGRKDAMARFAALTALLLLTHVPLAIVAYILCGTYALIMTSENRWQTFWRCKLAGLWGIAMALFFIVPAVYFRRFMQPPEVAGDTPWANGFMTLQNLNEQGRAIVGDALSMLVLLVLAAVILWRGRLIADHYQRREVRAWLAGSLIAAVLLFPVSAPLYDALKPWSGIVFPWRMQAAFVFATAFLVAIWMQWFVKPKRLTTWKADYGMLCALMVLLSFFMVGVRGDDEALEAKIHQAQLIAEPEYQTLWQDTQYFNDEAVFARLDKKPAQAEIISGKGTLEVSAWEAGHIRLTSNATKPVTVRLDHSYFPIWGATLGDGKALEITPEKDSGRMLVTLPAGEHQVEFRASICHELPYISLFLNGMAWALGLVCLWCLMRYKIACLALTKQRPRASFRP
jgi:hypothetical protein